MAHKSWFAAVILVGLLSQGVSPGAAARPVQGQPTTTRLTVSIFNDAGVAESVLSQAAERAKTVLDKAGVSSTWLNCGTPQHWRTNLGCQNMAFPTHLSVRLVAGRKAVSEDTFGQSYLDERGEGNYANIYLAQLSSSKALGLMKEGDLLGYVMVHEVGHLLLGKDSHSAAGLMRGRWEMAELQRAARGELFFTASETERIRARYLSAAARVEVVSRNIGTSGK
jgi:hypothetical protein